MWPTCCAASSAYWLIEFVCFPGKKAKATLTEPNILVKFDNRHLTTDRRVLVVKPYAKIRK